MTTPNVKRLTAEREAEIRGRDFNYSPVRELLAELDEVRAERDRLRAILAQTPGTPENDPAEAEWSAALARKDGAA